MAPISLREHLYHLKTQGMGGKGASKAARNLSSQSDTISTQLEKISLRQVEKLLVNRQANTIINLSRRDLSDMQLSHCFNQNIDSTFVNLNGANLTKSKLIKAILINIKLNGANLTEADLTNANLFAADLSEADLTNTNLFAADLTEVNLNNAKLFAADLAEANLTNAKLFAADLTQVNLTKAKLCAAVLPEANLTKANLLSANLIDANLTKTNLFAANLTKSNLINADLSAANLSNSKLIDADLSGAKLYDAKILYANMHGAKLAGADLTKAHLTHANLVNSNFSNANLSAADLTGAQLSNANFLKANLTEVNLTNANCLDTNLAGANLTKANGLQANLIKANLTKTNLFAANLTKSNLTNADLSAANLSNSKLTDANLSGAKLYDAKILYDNMHGANLSGADLTKAHLAHANVVNANFSNANLSAADLTEAELSNTNFLKANLIEVNLTKANGLEADLTRADLTGANLTNSNFTNTRLEDANLTDANLTKINLSEAELIDTNLANANLQLANLTDSYLINVNLANTNLAGVDFSGAFLRRINFRGANLGDANLEGVDIISVDFSGALLNNTLSLNPFIEWSDANLDLILNHFAHEEGSFLTSINSIDDRYRELKTKLALQLIHSLDRTDINLAQARLPLIEVLGQPPFIKNREISNFINKLIENYLTDSSLELLNNLESHPKLIKPFFNYFDQHPHLLASAHANSAFMQTILAARMPGINVIEISAVNKLYEKYLKLPEIEQQLQYRQIKDIFGDYEGNADWADKYATNYLLLSPTKPGRVLVVSESIFTRMLHLDWDTKWDNIVLFQDGNCLSPAEYNLSQCYKQDFPLFATPFINCENQITFNRLIESFDLNHQYKQYFLEAIKSNSYSTKLIADTHQQALIKIFSPLLDFQQGYSLKKQNYDQIINLYNLTSSTDREKAEHLLALSTVFNRYSSSTIFGTESDSPQMLRYYAYALMEKAHNLDHTLIGQDKFNDWKDRLLGTGNAFTCTALLSDMMIAHAKEHCNGTLKKIQPSAWR
ncbi:pentapeptide repeat-containing protein [Arsenophonus endosymbiont of Apis mellifera]|uniref:pentapeptide repeat-containing protein n=1 Tax=Arsenophonus endosymbiont of Apis mellifera TaxID=1541805 RepID=UPI0015D6F8F7|nr:pentapeptide repeat-containing protein [Arsenophonus endosymbiont of Apis mellifera]